MVSEESRIYAEKSIASLAGPLAAYERALESINYGLDAYKHSLYAQAVPAGIEAKESRRSRVDKMMTKWRETLIDGLARNAAYTVFLTARYVDLDDGGDPERELVSIERQEVDMRYGELEKKIGEMTDEESAYHSEKASEYLEKGLKLAGKISSGKIKHVKKAIRKAFGEITCPDEYGGSASGKSYGLPALESTGELPGIGEKWHPKELPKV